MRILILFFLFFTGALTSIGQVLSANNLLTASTLPLSKTGSFMAQKGFVLAGVSQQQDTVIHTYYFKGKNKKNPVDSITRNLMRQTVNKEMILVYQTGSSGEYNQLKKQLKENGFWCQSEADMANPKDLLFQHKDIVVHTSVQQGEEVLYTFQVQRKLLPAARNIQYAEDLLAFSSHENLLYVFGAGNVKKDIYYFSDKEFSRCSVLFPNTDRQAVFIWKDEVNDYGLSYLVLGGQLMLQGAKDYHMPVAENSWVLKSRLHAGMNLKELRRLNGIDFTFYGVSSKYSGMVLPDRSGKIDFRRENVVLACMNCSEPEHPDRITLSADEAIAEGRRLFVFTIILSPAEFSSN